MLIRSLLIACAMLLCSTAALPQGNGKARLTDRIRRTSDTSRVNAYINYGYWWEATNMDSAAFYYIKGGELARQIKDTAGLLRYYANYTYVLNQEGKLEQSLRLNLEALDIAKRSHTGDYLPGGLFNIGSNYNNLGNYDQALDYYFQAAELMEKINDTGGLATVYDNIAGVFTNSGQFEKAFKYNLKACENARKTNDTLSLTKTLINKGNTEYQMGRMTDAIQSVSAGLELAQHIRHPYLESIGLNTLANIYNRQAHFRKGLREAGKSLSIARNIQSRYAEVEALKTITASYAGLKNNDSCIVYALQALEAGKETSFTSNQYVLYNELATAYAGKNDFRHAFEAITISRRIQDSINKIEVERKMQKLESQYIVAQNEQRIISLERDKKQQQLFIGTLIAAIVAGSLLALLLYRNIQVKKRTAEQIAMAKEKEIMQLQSEQQLLAARYILQGQEDERSRLAKDLHDGLGGLLSGIKLALANNNDIPGSSQQQALMQLDNAMAEMRRIAHSMMPEALVRFGLTDALGDFCASFASNSQCKVHYQVFGIQQRLHHDMEIGIYRIVQELVNNAIRHSGASDVYIQLVHDENSLHLTVEDNGCGFDKQQAGNKPGIGLRNVSSRVDYLNGQLDIQTEKDLGTTITIIFNLKHD